MSVRGWLLCLCALACGACSFSDQQEACSESSDCGEGQECFKGFCVRSDDTSERARSELMSASESPDSGPRAMSKPRAEQHTDAGGAKGAAAGSGGGSSASHPGGTSSAADAGAAHADAAVSGSMGTMPGAEMPPTCEPRPEECNGTDEDCDGRIDEFTDTDCYPEGQPGCTQTTAGRWSCTGTCTPGKRACVDGKLKSCEEYKAPGPEACTDVGMQAADEDCNGATDETCACTSGETSRCYDGRSGTRDVGKCKSGTQTCTDGRLGACTGQVTPGVEDCSNMNSDDDCDGMMDNVRGLGTSCVVPGAAAGCSAGKVQCGTGAEPRCVGPEPRPETCNGMDDDCNGKVDDGFNLKRDANNCGECGHKCTGDEVCKQGECTTEKTEPTDPGPPPPSDPKGCSPACGSGQTCCGSTCVDLGSDLNNCGMCGSACAGATMPGCCGGKCVDLVSNQNCGRCGRDCSLLGNGGITCSCQTSGNGEIACTGPVLNLCL